MIRFYYNSNQIGPYQEDLHGFDRFANYDYDLTYPKRKFYISYYKNLFLNVLLILFIF